MFYFIVIIDLSVPIENGMPYFPGDPQPKIEKIEKEDYVIHSLLLSTHTGTHVDVPFHFIRDGKKLDEIDLTRFSGKAYVLDAEGKDIHSLELPSSVDILLIYTGSSKLWKNGWTMDNYATINEEFAKLIVRKGYKLVGIDSPSIGNSKVHRILLSNEILIVENLSSNLEKIKGKVVDFISLPLPIKGVDGSPIRAIAVVRNDETRPGK
ncbi:cyclase family protein [Acidianus ambivalens]|uniref:Cyclase family protein n=1 Tax=Acidianus ambivalens TaxID=2283 RepID=A0A650CWT8_ACIAM|nr:cyclase family protein [Acidianus ambivalens]MQL54444.1 cyclase family protein [Acidianus ambivalens]QGR22263.1 cyclase family protein [Acidianus ambivalens]